MKCTSILTSVDDKPDAQGFFFAHAIYDGICCCASGATPERALAFALKDLAESMLRVYQRRST